MTSSAACAGSTAMRASPSWITHTAAPACTSAPEAQSGSAHVTAATGSGREPDVRGIDADVDVTNPGELHVADVDGVRRHGFELGRLTSRGRAFYAWPPRRRRRRSGGGRRGSSRHRCPPARATACRDSRWRRRSQRRRSPDPARPVGPVSLASVPVHCSHRSAYAAGPSWRWRCLHTRRDVARAG